MKEMIKFIAKIFLYLKNKIEIMKNNLFYGAKGRKSKIIKPMRIIGKRFICIGDSVHILNDARIEAISEYAGVKLNPKLVIGDRTTIEQNCHIIAASELIIGSDCMFSAFVYIADCNHQFISGIRVHDAELKVQKTTIGNGVFIGIGARIMPGVRLGNNCVVGANAVVTHDVPDRAVVAGIPAKIIKYI